MASPGLKEEPVARPFFYRGGGVERGLAAAMAPAVTIIRPARLLTLKVQDAQRRVVARTMRRTDKLQVLMDYYYEMVCPAGAGAGRTLVAGRFVFDGKRLTGEQTLEDLGMKSGDKIDFFEDLGATPDGGGDFEEDQEEDVTLKLKVQDTEGRTVERTVERTQELQVIIDAYYESVPGVTPGIGKFLYNGVHLKGSQTPKEVKMKIEDEDENEILIDFFVEMLGGGVVGVGVWLLLNAEQPPVAA